MSKRKANVVVPFHAHVDHALDSASVSIEAGAALVADGSVRHLAAAARDLAGPEARLPDLISYQDIQNWPAEQAFGFGDIAVTLIPTPHIFTPVTPLTNGKTDERFRFPTRAWWMKKGRNYTALVEVADSRVLFVPSAGPIETELSDAKIEADLVVLGIGFAGWHSERAFESVWRNAVVETGACQVALVHWDDGKGEVSEATTLAPQGILRIDRTWQRAKALAKATNRQLIHLPVGQRVNIAELHDTSCR